MALIRAFARASPGGEAAGRQSGTRGPREALSLDDQTRVRRFESFFVPHLDAAYNFARWLTRDERNAEDVVQEACLRAFKFIDSFHGDDGRAWLLGIVRNTYYTWLKRNKVAMLAVPFDEESFDSGELEASGDRSSNPVDQLLQEKDAKRLVNAALERLPEEFREAVVLRELEGLSYKEIAAIAGIPLGTVMSRLARARKLLLQYLRQAQES
jgi:RNA polymerase sigma-70 factor, ECF subfamily